MAGQPPAFKAQERARVARWRKMPPAVFTPVLGAFGLASAWVRTEDAFGFPPALGQLLMGAATLLYLYLLGSYLAKVGKRPGVVPEDLKVLPGRAGLSALSMAAMLLAVALIPFSPALAKVVLVLALAAHALFVVLFLRAFLTGPAEGRTVTPVMHLTFVGFIVAPLAALPLGWTGLSRAIFWAALAVAVVIWALSARQFLRQGVPAPLRPLLAIHVAPASLLGTVAMLMGMGRLGLALGLVALAMVAVLLARLNWLLAAGFSPFWGAMTFPLAAFSSLMMVLGAAGYGEAFRVIGGLALVGATFFIPWVLAQVVQLWLKGVLAEKTNAAVA